MASDGQQYENFAEDQQYSEYNEQNYSEAMDEGGESGGQMQNVNGSSNGQSSSKAPSDDDRFIVTPVSFGTYIAQLQLLFKI